MAAASAMVAAAAAPAAAAAAPPGWVVESTWSPEVHSDATLSPAVVSPKARSEAPTDVGTAQQLNVEDVYVQDLV